MRAYAMIEEKEKKQSYDKRERLIRLNASLYRLNRWVRFQ